MSKSQTFVLIDGDRKANCMGFIGACPADGTLEVVIRNQSKSKTSEQLGALFGLWFEYLEDQTGYARHEIHRDMKRKYLSKIYMNDPVGSQQEMWVDSVLRWSGDPENTDKFERAIDRISLSWANVKQTSDYMDRVNTHWIGEGFPLPVPDKYHKVFRRAA